MICSCCKKELSLDNFYASDNYTCKKCKIIKAREYSINNKEKVAENKKNWLIRDKGKNPEKYKEKDRIYRNKNREKINKRNRVRYVNHGKIGAPKGSHNSPKTEFKKGELLKEKSSNWKGGITPKNTAIRNSLN